MMTKPKTEAEITAMRQSGAILAHVLKTLKDELSVGMTSKDLSHIASRELKAMGGKPAFLGYYGFPDIICVSINDEVVHGIPSEFREINSGDIVSMDFGVVIDNMITDAAISVVAGNSNDKKVEALLKATEVSLKKGIKQVKAGCRVGDIAAAVQAELDKGGYGIVRDLVGHGVGHNLHEEPNIPNYGKKGVGTVLKENMTIAIEPMATMGSFSVYVDRDGWTVKTRDGSLSAHFEHTVLVTKQGAEILTQL